jgi:hypothetical protein
MMEEMTPSGYRLQLSVFARMWRLVFYVALAAGFGTALVDPASSLAVRAGCVIGLALIGFGLRIVLGPAVIVRPDGLRIITWWPRYRDVAWYQIYDVEVVPGQWVLELELNSGERITLPVVERVDDLYEQIEDLRQRLDA